MTPCKNLTEFETRQVGRQFGGTGLMVAVYKPTIRYELIYKAFLKTTKENVWHMPLE